jgi:ubiquinone/menaquinone biosynthesis C-methylase UbiE
MAASPGAEGCGGLGVTDSLDRVRRIYDDSADGYDRKIQIPERLLFGSGRQWATSLADGRTLEVAAGTGRNLPYYDRSVALTAVDLSGRMLAHAERRAAALGRDVDFRVADAQALPFDAGSFDTVFATLALCSIPDDRAGTAEMARVLKPGGRLVLLDHVRSPLAPVRAVQRALEPLFLRLEADHLLREPERRVQEAGLDIESCTRSKLGLVLRLVGRKPR